MEASTELKFYRQITAAIASSQQVEAVLATITRAAVQLCRAHMSAVCVLRLAAQELEIVAAFGTSGDVVGQRVRTDAGFLQPSAAESSRSQRSTNAQRDRRATLRSLATKIGAHGLLMIPFPMPRDAYGAVSVAKRTIWHFGERDEALLRTLADSASIALQNADLRSCLGEASDSSNTRKGAAGAFCESRKEDNLPREAPLGSGPLAGGASGAFNGSGGKARHSLGRFPDHVSPREGEILNLLIIGKSCKEAAAVLDLSTRTVEHHVERLKLRFGQPRLHALVAYVVKRGVCALPTPAIDAPAWKAVDVLRLDSHQVEPSHAASLP